MKVTEIIKAQELCFLKPETLDCTYCRECPLQDMDMTENCQRHLAQSTIDKLKELTELLDDKTNHHYYDTLEQYQEMNAQLQAKLDMIAKVVEEEG